MRGRPHYCSGVLPHSGVLNDAIKTYIHYSNHMTSPGVQTTKANYSDSNGIGYLNDNTTYSVAMKLSTRAGRD